MTRNRPTADWPFPPPRLEPPRRRRAQARAYGRRGRANAEASRRRDKREPRREELKG